MGDSNPSDRRPRDLHAELTDVLLQLEHLVAARQSSALAADALRARVRGILSQLNSDSADASETAGDPAVPKPASPHEARRLKVVPNADGSSQIWIDDEVPFRMPRGLSAFLVHLASGKACAEDGLVEWKSRDSLLGWLCKYSGRHLKPSYVNNRVNVLRRFLRAAGIKRRLVDTDDASGVRFALRRSAPPTTHKAGGFVGHRQ